MVPQLRVNSDNNFLPLQEDPLVAASGSHPLWQHRLLARAFQQGRISVCYHLYLKAIGAGKVRVTSQKFLMQAALILGPVKIEAPTLVQVYH